MIAIFFRNDMLLTREKTDSYTFPFILQKIFSHMRYFNCVVGNKLKCGERVQDASGLIKSKLQVLLGPWTTILKLDL